MRRAQRTIDRVDALAAAVAVADQGSFVAAARRLGRSPAAISRAVAALEDRLGARLFNRTTRAVALTEAGARHLELCRRVLVDLEALDAEAARGRAEPTGRLTVGGPVLFGRRHVLPIVMDYLRDFPAMQAQLLLLDRVISLIDEGIDLSLRIGELADSSLRTIGVGRVARAVYVSPAYLAARGTPRTPQDLTEHDCIIFGATPTAQHVWDFAGTAPERRVGVRAGLLVNTAEAAIDAAKAGLGPTRLLSYQAAPEVAAGSLVRILIDAEPPPVPVHLVHPAGRHPPLKVRLFLDRAVSTLRAQLDAIAHGDHRAR